MVTATSLASVITLKDVTGIAYRIISESYRVTPVFIIVRVPLDREHSVQLIVNIDSGGSRTPRPVITSATLRVMAGGCR